MQQKLTRLAAGGVPLHPLAVEVLPGVVLTRPLSGPAVGTVTAHVLGHCGTRLGDTTTDLALTDCAPLRPGGTVLCADCCPDRRLGSAGARHWAEAADAAHRALTDAEHTLDRRLYIDPHAYQLRGLGAWALAPLSAAVLDPAVLGSAAGFFTDRAGRVAAGRAQLRAAATDRVGEDALAARAAPFAATVVGTDGRRAAPDGADAAWEVLEHLPDGMDPLDVDAVWVALLDRPWLDWSTDQAAAVCARVAGRLPDDAEVPEADAAAFWPAADFLLERWDRAVAAAETRRAPHLVAATGVKPAGLPYSRRQLLSWTLAGYDALLVRPFPGGVGERPVAAALIVPEVVAAGLVTADARCLDAGPLRPGDGPDTWAALAALWTPGGLGPLAALPAALAAARGVAATG